MGSTPAQDLRQKLIYRDPESFSGRFWVGHMLPTGTTAGFDCCFSHISVFSLRKENPHLHFEHLELTKSTSHETRLFQKLHTTPSVAFTFIFSRYSRFSLADCNASLAPPPLLRVGHTPHITTQPHHFYCRPHLFTQSEGADHSSHQSQSPKTSPSWS